MSRETKKCTVASHFQKVDGEGYVCQIEKNGDVCRTKLGSKLFNLKHRIERHHPDIFKSIVDQEIKKVDSWMRHNKLSLNYSKTVYMIFNSDKKQSSPFRVQIGSHLINRVNSTKYLGMHLTKLGYTYFKTWKQAFLLFWYIL